MPDIPCRVAQLEGQAKEILNRLDQVLDNQTKLMESQSRQKGFIAGASFALSAIVGVVSWMFNNGKL